MSWNIDVALIVFVYLYLWNFKKTEKALFQIQVTSNQMVWCKGEKASTGKNNKSFKLPNLKMHLFGQEKLQGTGHRRMEKIQKKYFFNVYKYHNFLQFSILQFSIYSFIY